MPARTRSVFGHISCLTRRVFQQKYAALIVIAATALTASLSLAAELVVISSSSVDFKAGEVIESTADIDLAKDATVILISESGKTYILKGPRSGPLQIRTPTEKNTNLISSLKKILNRKKTESDTLGVTRSVNWTVLPRDPWALIVGQSGKYCVTLSRPVVLWRAASNKTRTLILTNTATDMRVKTVWHSGQNTLHWPQLLPLIDGATYRVVLTGDNRVSKLNISIVPRLSTVAHTAVWMAKNSCEKQAARLLAKIK